MSLMKCLIVVCLAAVVAGATNPVPAPAPKPAPAPAPMPMPMPMPMPAPAPGPVATPASNQATAAISSLNLARDTLIAACGPSGKTAANTTCLNPAVTQLSDNVPICTAVTALYTCLKSSAVGCYTTNAYTRCLDNALQYSCSNVTCTNTTITGGPTVTPNAAGTFSVSMWLIVAFLLGSALFASL